MQFFHSIANWHGVVRAGWNEIDPVRHVPIRHRPLDVQFRRHRFDTEQARRSLGWTAEDHQEVVDALLNPPEGAPFYNDRMTGRLNVDLEAHPDQCNYGPGGDEVRIPAKTCLFPTITPEGSVMCSKPADPGEDYCAEHLEALRKQVSMLKAREAKAEKASVA